MFSGKCLSFVLLLSLLAVRANACFRDDFECNNGQCVDDADRCDGEEDCYDGSDEDNCIDVGLAVGLTIFFFILFCVCGPILLCVLIYCCIAGALGAAFRSHPTTTFATTTAAPTSATVVTSSAMQQKTDYPPSYNQPMQQYPPPQAAYPPQQYGYPTDQPAYPPPPQ